MGQAKRRRELIANYAPGQCNGCNLCCVVSTIPEIEKPAFKPCANLCPAGCSLHNLPSKPRTCVDFECNYVIAHRLDLPSKELLPHPKEAGAFLGQPKDDMHMVLYVDPRHPHKWQGSTIPDVLKGAVRMGMKVSIFDRGFKVDTSTVEGVEALSTVDIAEAAASQGVQPSFVVHPASHA